MESGKLSDFYHMIVFGSSWGDSCKLAIIDFFPNTLKKKNIVQNEISPFYEVEYVNSGTYKGEGLAVQ